MQLSRWALFYRIKYWNKKVKIYISFCKSSDVPSIHVNTSENLAQTPTNTRGYHTTQNERYKTFGRLVFLVRLYNFIRFSTEVEENYQ